MGVAFDDLFDQAIERRERIGKDRGAGRERGPLRPIEPPGTMHAAVAAESMGNCLMAGGKQAHRECGRLAQSGECRRGAREADNQRRRSERQGCERDDRAARAGFSVAARDDRDSRRQSPHCVSKGGAVGMPQAPLAHALHRSRAPPRDSCFAKAGANMQIPHGAF